MRTLTLKLPPELSSWLDEQSRELNRSKSEIARDALTAQRSHQNRQNAGTRAGDLIGKFASGRKDSSHKKHLDGFGS